jgi:hypothetical protein
MVPQRDATKATFAAGVIVALAGLAQIVNGHTPLGIAGLVLGPALIIQRILINWKRKRA